MTLQVIITPPAEQQIQTIDQWWRANRPSACDLFTEELAEAITMATAFPRIGRFYQWAGEQAVRKVLLRATRYYLYYWTGNEALYVVGIWSCLRRHGPKLG